MLFVLVMFVTVCFLLPNLKFRYGFRSKYCNKPGSHPSQRSRYIGGKTASFPLNLGKTVSGPIHSVNRQRNDNSWLQVPSQLREIPCPKFSESNQISTEVNKLVEKNVIEVTKPSPNQLVSHIFLASKKDGTNRPVINLKQLNKHVKYMHFKMEGIPNLVDLLQRDDHMCKLDLKDAYFVIPVAPRYQEYLKFRWNRVLYKFKVAPFVSRLGSTYLLKIDETDNSRDETFRNQMCNLSRRSYSPISGTSGVTKPATNDNLSVTKPGVHHQLGKICDKSNTANRVAGLSHRFTLNDNVTIHAKIKRPSKSMSKAVEERADISQTVGQNHRENVRSSEGQFSGSSTIQASTTLENSSVVSGPSKLRVSDSDHTRMQNCNGG